MSELGDVLELMVRAATSFERAGVEILHWERPEPVQGFPTVARCVRGETVVEASAHGVPLDELLDFVASLEPAALEPPTLR